MREDIRVIAMPLPGSIRAFTVQKDGFYTVIMRDDLSSDARLEAYRHELKHILNGDFDSQNTADLMEVFAHQS